LAKQPSLEVQDAKLLFWLVVYQQNMF